MIRTKSSVFHSRLRWVVLIPAPIALGAAGWWLAGPWLAALLASWPVWRAVTRWNVGQSGVRLDVDACVAIFEGQPVRRVPWGDVAGFSMERRFPPDDYASLMAPRGALLPLVPVMERQDGSEFEVWPLALVEHPKIENHEEAEQLLRALRAAWERALSVAERDAPVRVQVPGRDAL